MPDTILILYLSLIFKEIHNLILLKNIYTYMHIILSFKYIE